MAELVNWSLTRWGNDLTDKYLDDIHNGVEWIAKNQNSIGSRPSLMAGSGLSVYPIREHYVIFYPVAKAHIIIIAIMRQGRDIPDILRKSSVHIERELKVIIGKIKCGKIVLSRKKGNGI